MFFKEALVKISNTPKRYICSGKSAISVQTLDSSSGPQNLVIILSAIRNASLTFGT